MALRQISKFASSHHWVKEKEEKEVKVKMRKKNVSRMEQNIREFVRECHFTQSKGEVDF